MIVVEKHARGGRGREVEVRDMALGGRGNRVAARRSITEVDSLGNAKDTQNRTMFSERDPISGSKVVKLPNVAITFPIFYPGPALNIRAKSYVQVCMYI